jgi:hypothetical protein
MKQNSKPKEKLEEIIICEEEIDFTLRIVKNMKLNLDLAGIFYVNAYLQIKEGQKVFLKLQKEIEKYKSFYKKRADKYPIESEDFITYQLHKLRNIEVFYEPVVRHFSTAKILLVCCAETYVNEVAGVILNGKTLEEFDKLSIIGKWIFIQELTKVKKKLTVDKNPMQCFVELTKERNKLVHFKGMKKDLQLLEIPNYLEDLKLTPKNSLKNINSVRDLIRNFSLEWKGSRPGWLNFEEDDYRNPCFYLGNREIAAVMYSDKYDKDRF